MKVASKMETVMTVDKEPLTPCPCVHSSQSCFLIHRNAVIYYSCFLHVHLQGSATLKSNQCLKNWPLNKWESKAVQPDASGLACLKQASCSLQLSFIFVIFLLVRTIFDPDFMNEESRKRSEGLTQQK